jgi:glycosyltransferase involved in cell wall biosynthesis
LKLAIISHTEHYTTTDGTLVGWSPTVNEINHLLDVFETIYHLAMHYEGPAPKSVMAYTSDRIHFIPLPSVGGPKFSDKLKVLWHAPNVIQCVSKVLKQVDYFQLRTPTGIGVFLIPYLTLFSKKKGWYKYAGNWNQKHPPVGYGLQRWLLKHQSRKVTINGRWEGQPSHCLSFENPCLTENDLAEGLRVARQKSIEGPLTFCFVGRIEPEKGVGCILEALQVLSEVERQRIDAVHCVGEGAALDDYKIQATKIPIPITFHGALSRNDVFDIYKVSHAILMPTTASEGFPKVLAEAMAFGCIPIVSNMSSIGHYIKHGEQGFLLEPVSASSLVEQIGHLLSIDPLHHQSMLTLQHEVCKRFTFGQYHQKIGNQLLNP